MRDKKRKHHVVDMYSLNGKPVNYGYTSLESAKTLNDIRLMYLGLKKALTEPIIHEKDFD